MAEVSSLRRLSDQSSQAFELLLGVGRRETSRRSTRLVRFIAGWCGPTAVAETRELPGLHHQHRRVQYGFTHLLKQRSPSAGLNL